MLIRKSKNYLITAIISLIVWVMLIVLVTQFPPESVLVLVTFYLLTFIAFLLPLSVIFANSRRGLVFTVGILGILSLKPLGVFSLISIGAWWTIIILLEFWLSIKRSHWLLLILCSWQSTFLDIYINYLPLFGVFLFRWYACFKKET